MCRPPLYTLPRAAIHAACRAGEPPRCMPWRTKEREGCMKTVILGCGRVGATLAQILMNEGHDVTVVDQNPDSFNRLGAQFPEEKTILGNGTDEDVLRRAGIEEADSFVAVTNGDNRNILAAQIA